MTKNVSIAIDGPAAAGKSSVAKILASKYRLVYIDTGAMYRAFTYAVIKAGIDPKNEIESCELIGKVKIELRPNHVVLCNGEDVTKEIRTFEVSSNVSYIASYKDIRLELVDQQRELAKTESVIMDGRDIGTYVLPNADLKIFQIADLRKRAERRYIENIEKGIKCSLDDVIKDLEKRDFIDSNRAFAPLSAASDAIVLDTSDMTIFEVVTAIGKLIEEKLGLTENE